MKQNFTGYKIPKNLDFNLIEIKEDLKFIPKLDKDNYYYCFISTINNKWAIPQLCNNPNTKEVKDLKTLLKYLKTKRVSLGCHPASVDHRLNHSLDLLQGKVKLTSAFGPQHGAKGDKQDNMIETADEIHPHYKIPIFSLYGEVRRPTFKMMDTFDVVLFDLQDLGCRIYTFITTLFYLMQECEKLQKEIIILDRPNPIGRGIEGMILEEGFESFVGAGPIPMRYGLTVGELANWFKDHYKMNLNLKIY